MPNLRRSPWLGLAFTVLALFSVSGAQAASSSTSPSTPSSTSYDRLYVFGDSYSDTGAGYVDGNGPTAVSYLARRMGLSLAVPLMTGSGQTQAAQEVQINQSLNFAVSAAGTGSNPGRIMADAVKLGFGMKNQIEDFSQRVRGGSIRFYPATTLFFFAGGLNDKSLAGEETVANIESEIDSLYALGARHFVVALLPTKIPDFSAVGERLNPWLARIPDDMKRLLPDIEIRLSHWGLFFDAVLENPKAYGIKDTTSICAGRALFKQDSTPCASPETHFYYHAGHPSTVVHRLVGDMLFNELLRGEIRHRLLQSPRP